MRWLPVLIIVWCSLASADPPTLEARLATVARASEATVAAEPIRQARLALTRERELRQAGEGAAADRARRIADAALILSERLVARARARVALRTAEVERDDALRRREVTEAALERTE